MLLDERFGYANGRLSLVQVLTDDGTHCKAGDGACSEVMLYRPDGAPLELLYYGPNSTNPTVYWYVVTGKGYVIGLVDGQGKAIQSYHYDLWEVPDEPARFFPGQAVQGSTAVPQPLGYRGYVYDQETQSYWLSVRQYDPGLRRFLQPDPSELDGATHCGGYPGYVYCGDDPLDCSDPSGLWDVLGREVASAMRRK